MIIEEMSYISTWSPLTRFSNMDWEVDIKNCHTWGCHIYVLDVGLHTINNKIAKWDPRSRLDIYLNHSPHHAGNVALV